MGQRGPAKRFPHRVDLRITDTQRAYLQHRKTLASASYGDTLRALIDSADNTTATTTGAAA